VKRKSFRVQQAEVNADLLDGWVLVQLLRFDGSPRQQRRIQAHMAMAAALPLADCPCAVCESLRGQVSNA